MARRRMSFKQARNLLAFSEKRLTEVDDERRSFWQGKVDFYRRCLAGRCEMCGRELRDPVSVARRVGPECITKVRRTDPNMELSTDEVRDQLADAGFFDDVHEQQEAPA